MLKRKGFTLIELLVVIAVITVLAGVILPVFARAKARSRQSTCISNLKQISAAIQMYTADNDDRLPWQSFLSRYHEQWSKDTSHMADCLVPPDGNGEYAYWDKALDQYMRNKQVWFCPAVNSDEPISRAVNPGFRILTYSENKGSYACNYKTPTQSYYPAYTKPEVILCGSAVCMFHEASKVSLVWDVRQWSSPNWHNVKPPHSDGICVLFADYHVEWVRLSAGENNPAVQNYYINRSWVGLFEGN